ncbi:MAG: type III ribulose-bisphosphate carboxylase [Candidatus Aenigmarchaeota archaeon]|nr:type III ribulose-bisphosphate carboxylase [Candidatus Aenigmarchaeota archaeon]
MSEWYLDFVDLNHKPSKDDLICLFRIEPATGFSMKEAAGRVASESSAGTWTDLYKLPERIKKIMAVAFEIKGNYVKIAYPIDLWEKGNAPQLLSGIAGNIFGMKAIENLRLVDVSLPKVYLKSFKGPKYGIKGIRKILKVNKRPVTGAVPKPKIGYSAEEHAKIAFETWMGGFDLVKDDENLTSTSFNTFEKRIKLMAKLRDKTEKLTGERKSALLNITGETKEMIRKSELLHDLGWEFAMIDVVTAGTAAVQTLRNVCGDLGLAIHAHRAMHAAFDRNHNHGITMYFLGKIMRMIGMDQIHVGTVVGKLVGSRQEVSNVANMIKASEVKQSKEMLEQGWHNTKPMFPVSSGGIHPGLIPKIMEILGNDCVLLVSGGIHGHPKGTRQGAKAAMQAIEAAMNRISLSEYSKSHKELKLALEKWGYSTPK